LLAKVVKEQIKLTSKFTFNLPLIGF